MSGQPVRIETGDYLIRTITPLDASDEWGTWMADPEVSRMLNLAPRTMSRAEIEGYIKTFDLRSNLLWGIFDQRTGKHVGFFTVRADHARNQGLVNLLIGDPEFRHHRVLTEIRLAFATYFFETLGLKTMLATALGHNKLIIDTLIKAGWKTDKVLKDHVASQTGGPKIDLWLMSLSRDTWRERNRPA